MTDASIARAPWRQMLDRFRRVERDSDPYTEAALERHKREGLELAVKARWIALIPISVLLVFINPSWEVLYYEFMLALLALNGWFMRRVGQVGQSRVELALIMADLLIMTFGMVFPNPFGDTGFPVALQYRLGNFLYFFLILAAATMAYSWRTVITVGTWGGAIWGGGLVLAILLSSPMPELDAASAAAFADNPVARAILAPSDFQIALRVQEIVLFIIVAVTLGISARRLDRLLLDSARLERERTNLSRYFSPNVVEELSRNDEPLKQIRRQDVAVMFVDIVGFTALSSGKDPVEVIEVLRGFHARMEAQVFRHNGTLDKYLGDGLMATFGTPVQGDRDASDALDCARAMIEEVDRWNRARDRAGFPPIRVSIGVHHGAAVLGDIGANRLEFAVIGTSVNIASRLEALTRELNVRLVVSDDLRGRVRAETGDEAPALDGFARHANQRIRGIDTPLTVWSLA